jgi:hypothetical protein
MRRSFRAFECLNVLACFRGGSGVFRAIMMSVFVTLGAASWAQGTAPVITSAIFAKLEPLEGTHFSFRVEATGTEPLSYQWRRGSGPIAGATAATLNLANVQDADSDFYYVTVSNTVGTVEKGVVWLRPVFPPTISSQPANLSPIVHVGGPINGVFAIRAFPPVTIQLQKDGTTIRTYVEENRPPAFGGFLATAAQKSDAGAYRVIATNAWGTVTTPVFTVTVDDPPRITTQPQSVAVLAGGRAVYSVTATSGTPLRYLWSKGGVVLNGATAATLTIDAVQPTDEGYYSVEVSNAVGSVGSAVVYLSRNLPPTLVAQATDASIRVGSSWAPFVSVTGSDPMSYFWEKDGLPIKSGTTAGLPINGLQLSDAGSYVAVASNPFGVVRSRPMVLRVGEPPKITRHPAEQAVAIGGSATLSAEVTGPGPLRYRWIKGNAGAGRETAGPSCTFENVNAGDYGSYTLAVSNEFLEVFSFPAALRESPRFLFSNLAQVYDGTAKFATVTTVPANLAIKVGYVDVGLSFNRATPIAAPTAWSNYLVTVESLDPNYPGSILATSGQSPVFKIIQNEVPITLSGLQQTYDGTSRVVTATVPVEGLVTKLYYGSSNPTAPVAAGVYPVYTVFPNTFGFVPGEGSSGTLVVTKAPQSIAISAPSGTWPIGVSAELTATASSGLQVTLRVISGNATISGSVLTIADAGTAVVRATQEGNNNYLPAPVVDLTIAPGPHGEKIIFPAPSPKLRSAAPFSLTASTGSGAAVSFTVLSGPATVRGSMVTLSGETGVVTLRATVAGVDAANPRLTAVQSFAVLSDAVPVIQSPPLAQIAPLGGSAVFSVVAADSELLSYQWQKNGVSVEGATSATLRLTQLQMADAGGYGVLVSNGLASTLSAPAALVVGNQPTLVVAPENPVILEGGAAVFTAMPGGSMPSGYQWMKDGAVIVGATQATLAISDAQLTAAGSYTVRGTNLYGDVTSAPASLTVNPRFGAQHAVVRGGYTSGGTVTIACKLFYTGSATSAAWRVQIPPGWSFDSSKGDGDAVRPGAGATGVVEWTWSALPAGPLAFVYALRVPQGTTGEVVLQASAAVTPTSESASRQLAPAPLAINVAPVRHSADIDGDFRISLGELLRVLDLYNTRQGSLRTGAYRSDATSEDGFTADPTRLGVGARAFYHSADTNRDGRLSLNEITRVIELFNARGGSLRTGAYRTRSGTEDEFAPGP